MISFSQTARFEKYICGEKLSSWWFWITVLVTQHIFCLYSYIIINKCFLPIFPVAMSRNWFAFFCFSSAALPTLVCFWRFGGNGNIARVSISFSTTLLFFVIFFCSSLIFSTTRPFSFLELSLIFFKLTRSCCWSTVNASSFWQVYVKLLIWSSKSLHSDPSVLHDTDFGRGGLITDCSSSSFLLLKSTNKNNS